MKRSTKYFAPFFLVLFTIIIATACGGRTSSSSSSGSSDLADNGEVKFTLDGAQWVSGPPGHPEMKFEEEAITDGKTMVRIEGFAADGSHIALTVFDTSGVDVGTYPITGQGMSGFYKKDFLEGDGYVTNGMDDNPGSITITKLTDNEVEGTFQFAIRSAGDAEKISQITNGSFNLSFTKI